MVTLDAKPRVSNNDIMRNDLLPKIKLFRIIMNELNIGKIL